MLNKLRRTILFSVLFASTTILAFVGLSGFPADPASRMTGTLSVGLAAKTDPGSVERPGATADLGKLPLSFEANQGQTAEQVRFISRGQGYALFLTSSEAVLSLKKEQRENTQENAVLRIGLDKSNPAPEITAQNELPGKSNYFSGQSPQNWHTDVPTFARVQYKDVYPGVDQIFYGHGRQLEYDFIVAPHADVRQIALNFEGVEKIELDHEGELILRFEDGIVRQHKPIVYQTVGEVQKEVAGNYVLKNGTQVGFEIGEYDVSRPLVIDPVLVYSTYLGGTGYDAGNAIAVDNAGNAYIVGDASQVNFPTTSGSYQTSPPGTYVAKLNAAGNALVYSTYLPGGGGSAVAVDAAGNAYVAGMASTTNFPITPGAFQTSPGGFDVSLTKLNAAGNALIYSSRFGGDFDDFVRDIALDAAGNAYLAGWTKNPAPTSTFP
ncbi:MAG: SBBP repeat-containing protein, partial [Acidobacteria bacterium]|nr:SBBP repeat-containing protein [Acidobacteriota bacterium]